MNVEEKHVLIVMQEDWIKLVTGLEPWSIQAVILNIHKICKDPGLTWRTFQFQDGVDYRKKCWHTISRQHKQHITQTLIKTPQSCISLRFYSLFFKTYFMFISLQHCEIKINPVCLQGKNSLLGFEEMFCMLTLVALGSCGFLFSPYSPRTL